MDKTTQPVPPTGSIVVGTDGSEGAARALDWAVDHAFAAGRDLVVVHAVDPISTSGAVWALEAGVSVRALVDGVWEAGLALLATAAERVAWRHPDVPVHTVFREQDARTALLDLARNAELLVVGSRGRGPVASLLLGSVGVTLVRDAACPVAVVRPDGEAGHPARSGVLVGIDGHERCLPTVEAAFREAALRGVELTVANCVWDSTAVAVGWTPMPTTSPGFEDSRLRVAESLAGMREKFPDVPVHVVVAHGSVERCLLDLARTSEVVVVGRHGRSVLDHVGLGGIATVVVEHASTTVLVVPR